MNELTFIYTELTKHCYPGSANCYRKMLFRVTVFMIPDALTESLPNITYFKAACRRVLYFITTPAFPSQTRISFLRVSSKVLLVAL